MLQPDPVYVIKATAPVTSINFFNQLLQVGKNNGQMSIYCLSALRSKTDIKVSDKPISYLATTQESGDLVTQDRSGCVKLYDLERSGYKARTKLPTGHTGFTRAIIHKHLLFAPSDSDNISVIDVNSGEEINSLKPPDEEIKQVTSLAVFQGSKKDEDGIYLLSGYETGHLLLWSIKTFTASSSRLKFDFPITSCDYDILSNRGVVGGVTSSKVLLFGIDLQQQTLFSRDECNNMIDYTDHDSTAAAASNNFGVGCMKIRPDGKVLIVGSCDGTIYVHSWKSLRIFATLKRIHRSAITDIAFSSGNVDSFKSKITAVAGGDCISLWDIYYK